MAALALAGITGMYLRQVRQIGLLGLVGYVVFAVGYLGIMCVRPSPRRSSCPSLADSDPGYVNDVLAVATNGSATGDIGLMQSALEVLGSPTWSAASSSASRSSAPASSPAGPQPLLAVARLLTARSPSCRTPSTGASPSPTPSP